MIGQKLSPILEEVEGELWEFEANRGIKPEYTNEGFRAATKIFMSVVLDKMWELQESENIPIEDRSNMATKAGEDIRQLVKNYTNIDCHDLYKLDII
jgi:hypothetical protein